jgi:hypothetical protein
MSDRNIMRLSLLHKTIEALKSDRPLAFFASSPAGFAIFSHLTPIVKLKSKTPIEAEEN